jgi:DNA repair protein RecO (recombination protein O)
MPTRERLYRTEAIVLKRSDFGEADRLLTVFTPSRGKVRLIAKGVRKPTSRKSGHVELFTRVNLLVAVGRNLDIVTQAEALEYYRPLREDLLRATYAYYVAELLDAFAAERDENPQQYILIRDALGWLCQTNSLPLAARYYELHLLSLAGYQPQLHVCVHCKRVIEPVENYFHPGLGGVLCPDCGRNHVGTHAISLNALKVLRFLQTREWATCRALRLSPGVRREMEEHLHHYVIYHLERRLKSVDFLNTLRRQMGNMMRDA